ncbi:MAG TPA: bacillithiol biosynthesis deacetylase BshB1 [Gemmatimonadaceae bacterium]|nr:bacillithiol biosynthesis deacetylase BshB1 [Gemmatimonadaceae bacterium]
MPLDLLAIVAHPDDAELTCGGTLIKAARAGRRTGILDLTAGEMGSRGSAALRAAEAAEANAILGVATRETLGLPDAGIVNGPESRLLLARVLRRLQPRIVIAPAPAPFGRHPDHRVAAELIRDAVFVAGLRKLADDLPPFRPHKVVHCITYREDYLKPTFVVDISDTFDDKLAAIRCYRSQFDDAVQAGEVYPNGESLYDIVRHQAAHYGSLIRTRYGEPFYTTETMRVDDLAALDVSTF